MDPISIELLRPLGYAMRCAHVRVVDPTKEASFSTQNPSETQGASRTRAMPAEREGRLDRLLLGVSILTAV